MRVLTEFKKLFENTKEIWSKIYAIINSGHNGRSHQLVRNSDQRRRNKEERVRASECEIEVKLGMDQKKNYWGFTKRSQGIWDGYKKNDKNSEILSRLFEWGIIDGEGRLIDCKEKQEDNLKHSNIDFNKIELLIMITIWIKVTQQASFTLWIQFSALCQFPPLLDTCESLYWTKALD